MSLIDTARYSQQTSAARIMYHSKYKFTKLALSVTAAFLAAATPLVAKSNDSQTPLLAAEQPDQSQTRSEKKLAGMGSGINLSGIAREDNLIQEQLSTPPKPSQLRIKPAQAQIYEYDKSPLGNRQPFLFVH